MNVLKVEEEMANIKKNYRDMPAGKTILCIKGVMSSNACQMAMGYQKKKKNSPFI